ncbi:hypothetical protein [Homoserinimonas sp. A520]
MTIERVFDKIGCEVDDGTGTDGSITEFTVGPELTKTGICTPLENGKLVFFYEASSERAMDEFLASGKLEAGPSDVFLRDGAVLIVATDALTAKEFGDQFEIVD